MGEKTEKIVDTAIKLSELGVAMSMTPSDREKVIKAGFDYTKRTRRLPTLSLACMEYITNKEPPEEQKT